MKRHKSHLHFLVIEDVKEHAALIQEAVHAHNFLHDINAVKNCSMALELLKAYRKEEYLPQIIILDLNVSGMNAREFIRTFNSEKDFAAIPVLVFTDTAKEEDYSYVNGYKNCFYIIKPTGILAFMELINFICNFWSLNKKVPDYASIKQRLI